MTNEVTTTSEGGYLEISDNDFIAKLGAEANHIGGSGAQFMKMDGNTGQFSYGADDIELPLGTTLVMNYRSYKRGWLIWVGGEVKHEVMVGIEQGAQPTKTSLPDYGPYEEDDGPREQFTLEFKTHEEPFVEMVFQGNNKSKKNALGALLRDFAAQAKNNPGCYPIVEIDSNEFEAKDPKNPKRKFKKFAPKFKIVDWMTPDELNALSEGNPDDYENGDSSEGGEAPAAQEPEPETQTRPASGRATPRPAAATTAPAAEKAAPARRPRF